jgi:ribokinase
MDKIIVIGSANTDLVVKTSRIPKPGETVMGRDFKMVSGGKGANQAVAVARLGGKPYFVACLGKDVFGNELLAQYSKEDMKTCFVRQDEFSPSGIALISVDNNAENSIVVSPGANGTVSKSDIDQVLATASEAEYLLLQLEIPIDTVEYAIRKGYKMGLKVILNPAPAAKINDDCLKCLYAITPNETECEALTGIKVKDEDDAKQAAKILLSKGVQNIIITCGSHGSIICNQSITKYIPACKVNAVDTTAAGDVYNGALVVALSEGMPITSAAQFATIASSISVTRPGAQSSIPYRNEVDDIFCAINGSKVAQF